MFNLITALILIAGFSVSAVGAPTERQKEKDRTFEFKGEEMKRYGAEINADFSHLRRLFGMGAELDVSHAPPGETGEKGWLGIAMKLPDQAPREPGTEHVMHAIEVTGVLPGSAAEAAGLQEDDLIVELDNKPIEDGEDKALLAFRMAISRKQPGEEVKLRILRSGALLELSAVIRSFPRVNPVLKQHPDLEKSRLENRQSILADALKKENLTDEFIRLLREFRNETGKAVSLLVRKDDYNPLRLQEVNYVMHYPLDLPVVAHKITDRLHMAFDKTHHDLAGLLRDAMGELDMEYAMPNQVEEKPPADFAGYVERLVKAIQHANSERAAVLSVLDAEEVDFLYETAPELLSERWGIVDKKRTRAEKREDEARSLRFFQLVLRLDIPRLLNASAEVLRAMDVDVLAAMDKKTGRLERYPAGWIVREEENLTVIDTPAGKVLVGGTKDNTYTDDAVLILDFGGNDRYLNHAGGSTRSVPFSVVIDLSGDDIYSSAENFAQGAGLLGGGFLLDLEGNDQYTARNYSQGAGVLGFGVLADLAGRDQYNTIAASQGAGAFGIGVLAEGGGDDIYFGNRFVQGFGYVKGFGAIVEVAGNDSYFAGGLYEDFRAPGKSYQSLSQGFGAGMRPLGNLVGASGGIGVIAEAEGNDTYVADYFAQGASYWFALGVLDDRKGNDRYISGRYSQGAGIHMSAGALLDGEGDDNYLADFGVAQGCGHDYGVGFLLDNGGNDRYVAGVIAQGAGNDNGIGVLSDNGGNDEYFLKNTGQGRGNFDPVHDVGSFGLLFDTGGGNDVYSQGGKNSSLTYKTQWGVLIDAE